MISPIDLEVFKNRFASICEEMGVVLCRSSFSPNIKERKDFSCAIFDSRGDLVAQAAHIPVHLGSMPLSVKAGLKSFRLRPGDVVILNDPYRGGTHLPDITLVTPVFVETGRGMAVPKGSLRDHAPTFYVANRAHHSDVGGKSPGSMALASRLEEEGVVIPPTLLFRRGQLNQKFLGSFLKQVRGQVQRRADLLAQYSANRVGMTRLHELVAQHGTAKVLATMKAYQRYEKQITWKALRKIPRGRYQFEDVLDDDGLGQCYIPIRVSIRVDANRVTVDFSKSAAQVRGPVNATIAITLSCVAYAFRCLVLALTGEDCLSLNAIHLRTKKGTIVDAKYPAPVAGGNVETSQRIVDVLFGALAQALPKIIPAASQGTMNNIAMGSKTFTYYETLAGGMGARPTADGLNAIHTHMTNTLNTPIEALESELPLRVRGYRLRKGSGGAGKYRGGNGLVREYEFLEETQVSLLTERRETSPYGLKHGKEGRPGMNWLLLSGTPPYPPPSWKIKLPSKLEFKAKPDEVLRIETPGGGGWG